MRRAFELGVDVYRPIAEGTRSDMIFEWGGLLMRIQVKTGRLSRGAIVVSAKTFRLKSSGYVRGTYTPEEVDAIAAYCHGNRRCYLVPIDEIPASGGMHLRLNAAKNNQLKRLHFAADYELTHGAIAQLGERLSGTQEVAGSSPASSTTEPRIARLFS